MHSAVDLALADVVAWVGIDLQIRDGQREVRVDVEIGCVFVPWVDDQGYVTFAVEYDARIRIRVVHVINPSHHGWPSYGEVAGQTDALSRHPTHRYVVFFLRKCARSS